MHSSLGVRLTEHRGIFIDLNGKNASVQVFESPLRSQLEMELLTVVPQRKYFSLLMTFIETMHKQATQYWWEYMEHFRGAEPLSYLSSAA